MSNQDPQGEGFSYDEKLALVANEMMDPAEIGLASAAEARLKVMPEPEPQPTLGDPINFRASEVPLQLRALWAKQESKIAPFDEEGWMRENAHTHRIQAELRSGNMVGRLERTVTDPIDGFILLMEDAVEQLKKVRAQMKAGTHDVVAEVIAASADAAPVKQLGNGE
jgi:hypothetical protein